jgi:hypothetical protein
VGQLTDASVVLRLGYQAIRRAGLPTEEILTKAGVALNQVETNDRTPLNAQFASGWLQKKSVRILTLVCIWESICLYIEGR